MKLYGAIDLHSNNNVTVLIDEQDKVVFEKRLPNDLELIAQQLVAYQSSLEGIGASDLIPKTGCWNCAMIDPLVFHESTT